MNPDDRFVVLGLAQARTEWFSETARWASSGRVPIEFVKCLSVSEIRARLAAGRAYSALLADAAATGVDRDIIDEVRSAGCAVIVVENTRVQRDWVGLGASATIDAPFDPQTLWDVVSRVAPRISSVDLAMSSADSPTVGQTGSLITVVSPGGTGGSTVAMAIAQHLGRQADEEPTPVALLDASLRGDMALFHDIGDVLPGISELVEAHRGGALVPDDVREMFFDIPERGYHLLLGLRRRRDWTAMRARAFDAAIRSVMSTYRVVVADVDDDLDGKDATGSADMDDRTLAARRLTRLADLVVFVAAPGTKGAMTTVRGVGELIAHGVEPQRILVIVNRGPRRLRVKAEYSAALTELIEPMLAANQLALAPTFLPDHPRVEASHHYAAALPAALERPAGAAVRAAMVARMNGSGAANGPTVPSVYDSGGDFGAAEGEGVAARAS